MFTRIVALAQKIRQAREGAVAIQMGLIFTAVIGMGALASEIGFVTYKHRQMQSAADAAAFGAAIAKSKSANFTLQARALTAAVGIVDGANGVTVTANNPPATGPNTANASAVEVIITQPQTLYIVGAVNSLTGSANPAGLFTLGVRAVAMAGSGAGCLLQLSSSANPGVSLTGGGTISLCGCGLSVNSNAAGALTMTGGTSINLDNNSCSAVDASQNVSMVGTGSYHNGATVNGVAAPATFPDVKTGQTAAADPYAADHPMPSRPANQCPISGTGITSSTSKGVTTITYGGTYTGSIGSCYWPTGDVVSLGNAANMTLTGSVYYLTGGSITVSGNATLATSPGNTETFVLTGSGTNYATFNVNNGGKVTLTAPNSGANAGIAIFGDRTAPANTSSNFSGGSTMTINGAIYLPTQNVTFTNGAGNPTGCTQLIAGQIAISGGVTLSNNCAGSGTSPISSGSGATTLVE